MIFSRHSIIGSILSLFALPPEPEPVRESVYPEDWPGKIDASQITAGKLDLSALNSPYTYRRAVLYDSSNRVVCSIDGSGGFIG